MAPVLRRSRLSECFEHDYDRIAVVTSAVALREQRRFGDNPGSDRRETRRDFWRKRPRIAADRCGRVMAVGEGETRRGRATVAKPLRTRA